MSERQRAEGHAKEERRQRDMVEAGARTLRQSLYLADMGTVQQALRENNLGRANLLRGKYFPEPGDDKDLRGLEWRYLWKRCQGDETYTLHFNDLGVDNDSTVSAVKFSPDGRLVAMASFDNKVTILDAATKRVVKRLTGFFRQISSQTLGFSPDGKILVTGGGDQKIYFWDLASLEQQASKAGAPRKNFELRKMATLHGYLHEVWDVTFSPDGRTLVSGGKDGTARFWSGTPKADESVLTEAQQALRFSEDGNRLLTLNNDWTLSDWDIQSRQRLRGIDLGLRMNQSAAVPVSSDGKTLAVGITNATVEIWNLETRQRTGIHPVAGAAVRVLKFSRKDSLLLANTGQVVDGKWNSSVTVLNLATGQPPGRFDDISWGWGFSPDETLLAAGMEDYSITVKNLEARTNLARLKVHTWGVNILAFSPDGKRMMSASADNTIRLWDTTSWKELDLLRGHMGGVTAAAFSPDGRFLASGSADQALKLWDGSSLPAQELLSIPIAPHHPGFVMLSSDSSVLAVNANTVVTGQGTVLLLRAPSFAEIDARENSKKQEKAIVSSDH